MAAIPNGAPPSASDILLDMPETASLPLSLPELRALANAGGRLKYLFFWGHQPQPDGSIGAGALASGGLLPLSLTEFDTPQLSIS